MTDAQQTASRIHRLSSLARLHLGRQAAVSYSAASDRYTLELGGRTFAQGTFEEVTEAVTSRQEA